MSLILLLVLISVDCVSSFNSYAEAKDKFDKCMSDAPVVPLRQCKDITKLDLAILVDTAWKAEGESVEIQSAYRHFFDSFLKTLTDDYGKYDQSHIHIGVAKSDESEVKTLIKWETVANGSVELKKALSASKNSGPSSMRLLEGLDEVQSLTKSADRTSVQNVLLVVTRGYPNKTNLSEFAQKFQSWIDKGFVFVAMVEGNMQRKELQGKAGFPPAVPPVLINAATMTDDVIEDKGSKFANCLCHVIEDCQYDIVTKECHWELKEDGDETCNKYGSVQIIYRYKQQRGMRGGDCPPDPGHSDPITCSPDECNKDCDLKEWSKYGLCSSRCGPGKVTRKRLYPSNGDSDFTQSCKYEDEKECHAGMCGNMIVLYAGVVSIVLTFFAIIGLIWAVCRSRKGKPSYATMYNQGAQSQTQTQTAMQTRTGTQTTTAGRTVTRGGSVGTSAGPSEHPSLKDSRYCDASQTQTSQKRRK